MTSAGSPFTVTVPPGRAAEHAYVLDVVLGRWLGIDHHIVTDESTTQWVVQLDGRPDRRLTIPDRFLRTPDWLKPGSLPSPEGADDSVSELLLGDEPLPILFVGPGRDGPLVKWSADGATAQLGWDLLGAVFFLITRYEECVDGAARDVRGRFPSSASVLAPDWLQLPVADMYLAVLRGVFERLWPGSVEPVASPSGLRISHDVDHPSSALRWRGIDRVRVLGADAIRRRDPRLAIGRVRAMIAGPSVLHAADPLNTYGYLMDVSERVGTSSTFYFLTRDSHLPEGTAYSMDGPWVRPLLGEIAGRGHHIALHGSYVSGADPVRLAEEFQRLETAASPVRHALRRAIRQHYLRISPGITWPSQAQAGIEIDESLGFVETIGYRAGTARSFPAFDVLAGQPLPLEVQPLHIMDVSVLFHASFSDEEAVELGETMKDRTTRYGGSLSCLWHNSNLETPRQRALFETIVA